MQSRSVGVRQEGGESAVDGEINCERDHSDDEPSDIICEGDSEVNTGVVVVINLSQEPAVTAEVQGIDDHVDEGKQEGGQQEHGPTRPCVHIKTERFEYWVSRSTGQPDWKDETERNAVGSVEEKTK